MKAPGSEMATPGGSEFDPIPITVCQNLLLQNYFARMLGNRYVALSSFVLMKISNSKLARPEGILCLNNKIHKK